MKLTYAIHDVSAYINWVYFFHAWGFQRRFAAIADIHGCDVCRASWLTTFQEEDRAKAAEAMQLFKEANRMLNLLDEDFHTHAIYKLCVSNADGDNLLLDGTLFPLLRQQTHALPNKPFLCLSDFVRPLSSGIADTVGIFACTVDVDMEHLYADDPYKRLLVQTLADRLAEATAEKMQEHLRDTEKFQGIRPAVGYPSLPDHSVNFILNDLLHFNEIGISLTESAAMTPHASVSGLMLAHPQAHYFAIGKIGEDQLQDYAHRRGMKVEEIRKFLISNIQD
ncbi:5-methyltetrahydrofolate--homocysteine methyltransferase [Bacteroides sp. 214]|uniref:vitamin B12 dependent-methionine synthase activation domain-containing protein n=1 Tax=Bacteroides sp. 214 TaxID=2302935 RepID=UPI0013CF834A|nr:vitamin B12 dependent-methionine synthase activation domain-containing protein [Bacteroides sp. 214]NDW11917.1 5-methyltetrahydrofolate--homocysteine methyltransferase [Bacteroides sp. 214]